MKFLIFNIVVAAALVFLFAGDKGDLTAIAGKTEKLVSDIKSKAVEAVAPPRSEELPATPASTPLPKPAVAPAAADTPTPKLPEAKAAPLPAKAAAKPLPTTNIADRTPKPPLSPDVAKRRAVVLDDSATVVSEGTAEKFMPADIRKRELMLLSEEMELFSAKAISR